VAKDEKKAFEWLGAKRSMLSDLEKSSKSRITKEAKLAKNSKTPTFRTLGIGRLEVKGGRG
jgi:hypothetical protein